MYRIQDIYDNKQNRFFKIQKSLKISAAMKTKKQKVTSHSNSKKNNKPSDPTAPLHKQFQLIYRTCDRLPSSQQYQSVLFMKRKKINNDDHSTVQQTKSKKKKQSSKKKKTEEKPHVKQKMHTVFEKTESMCLTKSTMPSTTAGFLKKSTFADTFKQKIDLEKSSIRKVNNLSNSNSSRYLSSKNLIKQEKSPNKKTVPPLNKGTHKSPNKKNQTLKGVQSSNKSIQQNLISTNRIKNAKSKGQRIDQIRQQKLSDFQYAFIDGQYLQIDKPSSKILLQKITSQNKLNTDSNEFIRSFQTFKNNFEENQKILSKQQQINKSISSETQQLLKINYDQFLRKVIVIQRWWRYYLQKKKIQQCNNIKHFPSVVQSERSNSNINPSPRVQQDNSIQNQDESFLETPKRQEGLLNFITKKQNLIMNHMKSQKEILNKMLQLNKIDTIKYSQSLMEVQSNYQKQMNSINKLKLKIQNQNQKIKQLKLKIKEKSQILNRLQKIPTNVIFKNFFQSSQIQQSDSEKLINSQKPVFQRQKSTGCHYSLLNQTPKNQGSNKLISYKKTQDAQTNSPQEQQASVNQGQQEQGEDQQDVSQGNSDQVKLSSQILELYADRQLAQTQIQKRYANQLGIGSSFQLNGIKKHFVSTSVLGIHNFLMNFLKFYQYFYKDQFLKMINLPYGYNQKTRIKIIQGYSAQKWLKQAQNEDNQDQIFFNVQSIIGEQVLEDFHEHNYHLPDDIDDATKAIIYFEKIHQQAVIDCFNEALSSFRPYYFINGAPYSWNYSEKALTFYYIAQQNIQQVFQKTQYKVLKNASCLCGTIVEGLIKNPQITQQMTFQQQFAKYRESVSPVLAQTREQKLGKIQKQELQQGNYKWQYYEQNKTQLLFSLTQSVFNTLLEQLLSIKPLGQNVTENLYITNKNKQINQQTQQSQSQQSQQSNKSPINSTESIQRQEEQQEQKQQDEKQNQQNLQQQNDRESQNKSNSNPTSKKLEIQPIQFDNDRLQQDQECQLSSRQRQEYYQGQQGQQQDQQGGLQYQQQSSNQAYKD